MRIVRTSTSPIPSQSAPLTRVRLSVKFQARFALEATVLGLYAILRALCRSVGEGAPQRTMFETGLVHLVHSSHMT